MLVHMAPQEVAGLQALALAHGGSLTINPETGLPEAGFLKKLLPMLAGAALNYFLPGVGMAVGEALGGIGAAAGTGVTVGAVTGLATGDLSKGLTAGLGAYGGAGLMDSFMGAGAAELAQPTITSNMPAYTGDPTAYANEVNALRNEALTGVKETVPFMDKASAGFNAITKDPSTLGNFAANNFKYGLAAMAPTLADQGVSTVTKIPNNGLIRNFDYDPMTQRAKALNPVRVADLGYADGGLTNLKRYADGGDLRDGSSQAAYDYLMGRTNTTTPNAPINAYTPQKIYMPNLASAQTTTSGGITDLNTSPLDTVTNTTTSVNPVDATYNVGTTDTTGTDNLTEDDTSGGEDTRDQDAIDAVEQAVADDALAESAAATDIDNATIGTESQQADAALAESANATDIDNATIAVDNQPAVQETTDGGAVITTKESPVQETTDGGATVTMPDYIAPDDTVIQQQESPVQNQPDGSATVTLPADNINSQDNTAQDTFNQDTGTYVDVGDAGGDYGSSGDFGGGGRGGSSIGAGGNDYVNMFDDQAFAQGGMMGYARGGSARPFFSQQTGKFNYHSPQMYASGGLGSLGGYSDGGRLLRGPGDGVSDSIPATIGNKQPARLADGEFVVPARIVSELGNGSTEAGARKLYQMMDRIQAARGKTVGKGRVAKNSRADKHLPA